LQLAEIIAIAAIFLAAATGVGIVLLYRRLLRYQRNQHVIMGSRGTVDIVEHVTGVDEKMTNLRVAVEDLTLAVRDHDVRIDGTLSRVGVVRFDAYHDLGGRQSTAVAFLNHGGNGVVITTMVSRDFARMYVKLIRDGQADIPLTPEESEAVDQARGSTPFTIRPRVDGAIDDEVEAAADSLGVGAPMSLGLPGLRAMDDREVARENRRRKRHGMPLVDGKVVPSARGWDARETPSASMADDFVKQRRQNLGRLDDDETAAHRDDEFDLDETKEFDEL
jgi:hypothetical protein